MQIIDTIGKSPVFWNRNVVFVVNLMGPFFGSKEETQMLADEVAELDLSCSPLTAVEKAILGEGSAEKFRVIAREIAHSLLEQLELVAVLRSE